MSPRIVKHGAIGQPFSRVDGRLKVTGAATFTAEYKVENITHGALVFSRIARGKIKNIDTRAALEAPGVCAVLTHENAPEMKQTPVFGSESDRDGRGIFEHSVSEYRRDLFLRPTRRRRHRRNA